MKPRPVVLAFLFASSVGACGGAGTAVRAAAGTSVLAARPTATAASTSTTTRPCTDADLDAPPINAMPSPQRLTAAITLDSGDQTLSPPDRDPKVPPAHAWGSVTGSGFGPRASGRARLLLADLSARTPATIRDFAWPPTSAQPDTRATPIYTHTLVWVVIATEQAEVPAGGGSLGPGATTVPGPECFLETAVTYVDAETGTLLMAENF